VVCFARWHVLGIANRLELEGIQSFSLSPGKKYTLAAFVPERKGQPAIVRLYDISSFKQALCQKTFFRADTAQYYWNVLGTSILVLTHTEMDKTGKSYYGETGLYFLAIAGNFECRVELKQTGNRILFNLQDPSTMSLGRPTQRNS
jgi:translation initiation factor 2A